MLKKLNESKTSKPTIKDIKNISKFLTKLSAEVPLVLYTHIIDILDFFDNEKDEMRLAATKIVYRIVVMTTKPEY